MQSTSQALKMQSRSFSLCCCTCSKGYSRPSLPSRRDWVKASQLFSSSSSSSSILWRGYQSTSAAASSASATAATSEATAFRTGESPSSPSTSSKASSASNVGGASEPLSSFFKQSFMRSDPATGAAGKQRATDTPADMTSASSSSTASSLDVPLQNIGRDLAVAIPPIATPTDAWRPLPSASSRSISSYLSIYKQLAKGRLSAWIVLTAMAGYAMCPTDPAAAQLAMDALVQDTFGSTAISSALSNAGDLAPSATSASTSSALNDFRVTTLLATAAGTALCSASANTFNQLIEIPYDAQMPRTAKRPLPSHLISPLHAFTFGSVTAISGVALLYGCVNPLTASLGLLNIILYAGVYTPLKRLSVVNTWIGALVGGIPPLMGWAACTNSLDPFSGQAGAWVLALILFAWQFPHFNSLSWTIRSEYARGGYRMLSALNPAMNARVSLRWTVAGALAAGVAAPMVGLTSWAVGLATLIPSGALGVCAWKFWRAGSKASLQKAKGSGLPAVAPGARATDKDPRDASARSLFFVSLVHLPALLFMMMAGKIWGDYQEKSEASESIEQATRQQCNDGGISHQRVSAIRTTVGDQGTGAGV